MRDVSEEVSVAEDIERLRRQLAKAEESQRSHIARELHDDYSQRLMAMALNLRTAQRGEALAGAPEVHGSIVKVQAGLEALGADLHDLSRRLHPTVLDDLGLSAALRSECKRRSALSQVPVDIEEDDGLGDLQGEIALALFRVAQEAMSNAIRHGKARRVRVLLHRDQGDVVLCIEDNGVGFDPSELHGPGIGLSSMRERVRMVDGDFDLSSVRQGGTSVTVRIPCEPAIEQHDDVVAATDD